MEHLAEVMGCGVQHREHSQSYCDNMMVLGGCKTNQVHKMSNPSTAHLELI